MKIYNEIGTLLFKLREKNPLVHQITNYVTANDCANITLAIGASPVMAHDINEVSEIVSLASSLVINIGTLNSSNVESMIKAGKRANELNIPVILDPVGAGAASYRTETAKSIINEVKLAVIRGNLSEIKTLCGFESQTKGVDTSEGIADNGAELIDVKHIAKKFAANLNTVIAITGSVDIITDGETLYTVNNGHEIMSRVSGTGCMCTALIGSYLAADGNTLLSALSGIVSMGIAGEMAFENLIKNYEGTGSLKTRIIDAVYNLNENEIARRANINEG